MSESEGAAPDLPELDAEQERALESLLRSAFAPTAIHSARHERLLQAALVDPFADASDEERAESERLRRALSGNGDHPSSSLARALSAAHGAQDASLPSVPSVPAAPVDSRLGKLLFYRVATVGASLALAAAVTLWLVRPPDEQPSTEPMANAPDLPALAYAQSRSTASLFAGDEPGPASTRIDRIASARARDLRDNRFAAWGVR